MTTVSPYQRLKLALAALALAAVMPATLAQDILNPSPRGLVDVPSATPSAPSGTTAAGAPAGVPLAATPVAPAPLPQNPSTAARPLMFGSQMFSGRFASQAFGGFNPDYRVAVGDRISVRMWGAFSFDATQTVDAQGNIFIPNVGPIRVLDVRNGDLNAQVVDQIKRTYRSSVGVYATLEGAQPVKIYVTGFVRAPGLYGGLSSDSVLYYLDRAGGIDPDRGSYLSVEVRRLGRTRATVDLYAFLLDGQIAPLQLQDGDTIVVAPRQHTVQVDGEVLNPYMFEFARPSIRFADLMAIARPRPGATHVGIARQAGSQRHNEYHPLAEARDLEIRDGDVVTVSADKIPGTILVRIEGAHLGAHVLVMNYGAQLKDALARVTPAPESSMQAVQLFRRSVAQRQKELMESSLRGLETYALTARSSTSEEAALRAREGQAILEFVERARKLEPRGQVILSQQAEAGETLLEDGDVIRIPERSNLIQVSGEVVLPNALVYDARADVETYIERAGGYTQGADRARVVVLHQDGSVAQGEAATLRAGDEILVLPKIEAKSIEITRSLTQIVYQIAVAVRIALNL